ncbi:MAG: 3-phosphoshikimate 1-carboxyvinyltransferase [Dysgonamonadaceae bacterium]|jgi:3-phosphoshikimate 1-carboxyvinyltransferase|nr:3-phosphoshikimate 1-carboxyvinyltransferase [Dysgonamonadaceae bacterium]
MIYSISLPASKSISNRVLIINALTDNPLSPQNISDSDDTKAMLRAFANESNLIDIGAAGTAMRFLTAYYTLIDGERILTGTERMNNRPIKPLVDALLCLGAEIEYLGKEGFPPLNISGRSLAGGKVTLDGSVSSQYLSALMMIAPAMANGLEICLKGNIVSRPYIEMTAKIMEYFGVKTEWSGNIVSIRPQKYIARDYSVESDWSAASYWFEIAALMPERATFILSGLEENSWQGDAKVAEFFGLLGIKSRFISEGLELQRITDVILPVSFEYDFTDVPDLAQTMAVTFCCLGIKFIFSGLQSLKIKETDRIFALQTELRKLGFVLESRDNSILEWNGATCEADPQPVIATYEDHRMAMAFAPARFKYENLVIENKNVVSKSYPNFWEEFNKI